MTVEEATPVVLIWPDNIQSVNVFVAMSDQWLCGPSGPIGLNIASLPEVWRRTKTPPAARDAIFEDLRTMADAALAVIRAKK